MPAFIDARLPVVVALEAEAGQSDALLIEGQGTAEGARGYFTAGAAVPGHAPGCACCAPRNAAGLALAALLLRRARGQAPFFTRVVAVISSQAGRAALDHALANDPLASSCFKPAQSASSGLSPEPGHG